jgi:RNA polymerase sigma-70 factor (ECF subfamily)
MPQPDEQSLIERARHDPQAFAELYDRYVDRIYAYSFRCTSDPALAQDVTSATFEKALRHLQRKGWKGQSYCAWLYRIARNELIAYHRQNNRLAPLPADQAGKMDVECWVQRGQQRRSLREAFARLAESDREVLSLRLYEELSSAETAEILGCSIQNVYVRLHRALERLRRELQDLEENSGEQNYVPKET